MHQDVDVVAGADAVESGGGNVDLDVVLAAPHDQIPVHQHDLVGGLVHVERPARMGRVRAQPGSLMIAQPVPSRSEDNA